MSELPYEYSPEEQEDITKNMIKRYKRKAYWTFYEGINLLLPFECKGNYPLQFVINDSLFDDIKRDVEAGELETINTKSEITQVVNYDPQAVWEKFDKDHPREKPRRKLTHNDIKTEKQDHFYKKIKITPALFIEYVKENFNMFSAIEIPTELENDSPKLTPKEELNQLLLKFYPEVELFYSGFTKQYKKDTNNSIAHAQIERFKEVALSYYSNNEKKLFTFLKKEHINSDNIYEILVNQRKATIGKILKIVVDEQLPIIALDQTITTHGNALYGLARTL